MGDPVVLGTVGAIERQEATAYLNALLEEVEGVQVPAEVKPRSSRPEGRSSSSLSEVLGFVLTGCAGASSI